MRKSADVVTLMQLDSEDMNIRLLFPKHIDWEQWKQYKPDVPFSKEVIDYLNSLSVSLLRDKQSRLYPDVVTFAFFCRKANIVVQKEKYFSKEEQRIGRGILFHIAPSNVPINFGYSLVAGLLGGNYNVVRVSSKEFPQVSLIVKHMFILEKDRIHKNVSNRIALVQYERTSVATDFFSSFCNVRIIWGGDMTIWQIRKSAIPARSFDVTFANRYSMAVIRGDELMKENEKTIKLLAEGFYNDTYLFDQNACSAPHLIVWLGKSKSIQEIQQHFWEAIQRLVEQKYKFQSVLAIDKLTTFYKQAVNMSIEKVETKDNKLIRVLLKELNIQVDAFNCAGGYFSEYVAESLEEIVPIIKDKYQTMAYYGFTQKELMNFVVNNRLIGIDRIVPVGETTNFTLIWDGYRLVDVLSREYIVV